MSGVSENTVAVCARWEVVLLAALGFVGLTARAQEGPTPAGEPVGGQKLPPLSLPLETIPDTHRERVRAVVDKPTLSRSGVMETFTSRPELYAWLLDHPDKASDMWRKLGARCVAIDEVRPDCFSWSDPDHGFVHYRLVHRSEGMRIWYADGKVKAAALMPATGFQAVLVARFRTGHDGDGDPAVRHQYHFFLKTDGKAAALAARLLGASAPKLVDQFVSQLQMFFKGLAWLAEDQPGRARAVMRGVVPDALGPVGVPLDEFQGITAGPGTLP